MLYPNFCWVWYINFIFWSAKVCRCIFILFRYNQKFIVTMFPVSEFYWNIHILCSLQTFHPLWSIYLMTSRSASDKMGCSSHILLHCASLGSRMLASGPMGQACQEVNLHIYKYEIKTPLSLYVSWLFMHCLGLSKFVTFLFIFIFILQAFSHISIVNQTMSWCIAT